MDSEASTAEAFRELCSTGRTVRVKGVHLVETLHRPRAETGEHTHDRGRLCLVVAGEFEELNGPSASLKGPGTLLLYPPGSPHDDRFSDRGARCLNIELPFMRDRALDPAGPKQEIRECHPALGWLAARSYDELRGRGSTRILASLIGDLLGWLGEKRGVGGGSDDRVEEARTLVEERAFAGISLSTVAGELGADRFELARAFRDRFQCSLGEYRHRAQVNRARDRLLSTDLSLSSIAYQLGFADQSHFTRIFKRYTGLPPGRYRALGC